MNRTLHSQVTEYSLNCVGQKHLLIATNEISFDGVITQVTECILHRFSEIHCSIHNQWQRPHFTQ